MKRFILALFSSFSLFGIAIAEDAKLQIYKPEKITQTNLTSVGSDSMDKLVQIWVEDYKKLQPEITLNIVSRGSATAPAALIDGTAHLGPMSRPMKESEKKNFIAAYGFEPTEIKTSIAAIAIYVPKSNPAKEISFEKLNQIFGNNANSGALLNWNNLGVRTANPEKVLPLGMNSDPIIGGFFKQSVLSQKSFSEEVLSITDNQSLFHALEMNPTGIGFGHYSSKADLVGMKMLAVKRTENSVAVYPTQENILNGSYPLARNLSIYVVREPGAGVDAGVKDFFKYVLSAQGQKTVAKQGLMPLPVEMVKTELGKLE
jgi:phosphate transport system substrate-binding protein